MAHVAFLLTYAKRPELLNPSAPRSVRNIQMNRMERIAPFFILNLNKNSAPSRSAMMLKILQGPLFRMTSSLVPAVAGAGATVAAAGVGSMVDRRHDSAAPSVRPLTAFDVGARLRIVRLGGDEATNQRLMDLGLREGVRCSIVLSNGKLIVSVGECRIALRREVAMHIQACELSE